MSETGNKTYIINLSKKQVRDSQMAFIEELLLNNPDESAAFDAGLKFSAMLDRKFIRTELLGRVEGNADLDWLHANLIPITVKSSLDQYSDLGFVRIQILKAEDRKRFDYWRNN